MLDAGITLTEAKSYLRVDHDSDDVLIQTLIEAAQEQAEQFLGHDFTETDADTGEVTQLPIPATVKLACLRMVAAFYESRADGVASEKLGDHALTLGQIPWDVQRMLWPYRKNPGL